MRRRKYLILTLGFPPDGGGWAEYIYNFSKHLDGDITVLFCKLKNNREHNKECYKHLKNFSVMKIYYFSLFPWVTHLIMLICSISLHIRKRFDLIICNHVILGRAALFLKKIFNINYFLITYGWEVASKGMYSGKYTDIIKEAERIISVSHFTKQEVLRQYPEAKNISIIHPMVNEEIVCRNGFDSEFRRRMNLQDKKILLTVGRLNLAEGHKGHDLVLIALPEIIKKYPDLIYTIVGNGDGRKALKAFAQDLKIADKVIFHDYDRGIIHNYYSICDIFIMPNRIIKESGSVEGFGIVFLEAALFGKPSIGGKTGGASDAIIDGKTGLLVNPTSASEITNAVLKLLDNPTYAKRLGEEAKRRVLDEFSSIKMDTKIKQLFAET